MPMPRGFSNALNSAKSLDQRIASGGQMQRYLDVGEYDVRVVGVDRNNLEDNKLTIKYADADGREHRDMIFLLNTDRKTGATDFSWRFLGTIGALIPDTDAYTALLAELNNDNEDVLDLLVGLQCKIVLKRGKGFGPAVAQPDGTYSVADIEDQHVVFTGSTIGEAEQAAKDAGLKKAFVNITQYAPIADVVAANVAAFTANFAATQKPQARPFPLAGSGMPF